MAQPVLTDAQRRAEVDRILSLSEIHRAQELWKLVYPGKQIPDKNVAVVRIAANGEPETGRESASSFINPLDKGKLMNSSNGLLPKMMYSKFVIPARYSLMVEGKRIDLVHPGASTRTQIDPVTKRPVETYEAKGMVSDEGVVVIDAKNEPTTYCFAMLSPWCKSSPVWLDLEDARRLGVEVRKAPTSNPSKPMFMPTDPDAAEDRANEEASREVDAFARLSQMSETDAIGLSRSLGFKVTDTVQDRRKEAIRRLSEAIKNRNSGGTPEARAKSAANYAKIHLALFGGAEDYTKTIRDGMRLGVIKLVPEASGAAMWFLGDDEMGDWALVEEHEMPDNDADAAKWLSRTLATERKDDYFTMRIDPAVTAAVNKAMAVVSNEEDPIRAMIAKAVKEQKTFTFVNQSKEVRWVAQEEGGKPVPISASEGTDGTHGCTCTSGGHPVMIEALVRKFDGIDPDDFARLIVDRTRKPVTA